MKATLAIPTERGCPHPQQAPTAGALSNVPGWPNRRTLLRVGTRALRATLEIAAGEDTRGLARKTTIL